MGNDVYAVNGTDYQNQGTALAARDGMRRVQCLNGVMVSTDPTGAATPFGGAPGDYTAITDPFGIVDDTGALNAAIASARAGGGGYVRIPAGSHRFGGTIDLDGTVTACRGINLDGCGRYATKLILTGSGYDGVRFKNTNSCGIRDLQITTTGAKRTSGNAIHVVGGDSAVTFNGSVLNESNTRIERVIHDNQFNGFVVENDEVLDRRCWKVFIDDCAGRLLADGGSGIWLNTCIGSSRFGASHFIRRYFHNGPTLTPALAAIRLTGTGDATLEACETHGPNYGILMDPVSGGFLTSVKVIGGFMDGATNACLRIAPNATVDAFGEIDFNNVWFASSQSTSNIEIVGARASDIHFVGGQSYHGSQWGAVMDACAQVTFNAMNFKANASGGAWFKNSAAHFMVKNGLFGRGTTGNGTLGAKMPIGVQIDAGSDFYNVTENDLNDCTTPLNVVPADAANRRNTANNIT